MTLRKVIARFYCTGHAVGYTVRPMRNLSKHMKARGITQVELARLMGVSQPTVWAWIHGYKTPTRDNLIKLADVTGLTVDSLLDRKAA